MFDIIIWIVLGLVVLIGGWLVVTYNGLIRSRNHVDEAWSDIDVQLKRRYNLIPNLMNTVKGYAEHEKSTFNEVAEARSKAMQAESPAEHAEADNMLQDALKSLFAVAEDYPDLKASGNFMHLQEELTDAEDKIQSARRFYNANVREFNTKLQVFPTNLIANMLGFEDREYFDAPEESEAVPEVDFSDEDEA
jgi:LemA protein